MDSDFEIYNPVAFESRRLPSSQEQLSKHQAGQFEWVLSIPLSNSAKGSRSFSSSHEDPGHPSETKKLFFGCNLVHRRTRSGDATSKDGSPANVYTLLATQLEGDELSSTTQPGAVEETEAMSATQVVDPDTTIIRTSEPDVDEISEQMMSETTVSVKNDDIVEHIMFLPPARPTSRIETSVEALDKLEEELESVAEVAKMDRVLSPGEARGTPKPARDTPTKSSMLPRSNSTAKRPVTNTVRTRTLEGNSSFRQSTSLSFSMEEEKDGVKRKSTISRPASLLPPKAPAKSSKPPTVSTFELPGAAVARRLKEQRAARLSQHYTPDQVAAAAATYSPSKPHVKSTKPPTRPTFELPGDAFTRRKKEEREAKMRAQDEEERRRREFKARPIRASIVPSSYPRETIASKARRGKTSQAEEPAESSTPAAKKRQSLTLSAMTASRPSASTGAHLSATLPSRGRTSMAGSASGLHISRATSTASTASIHGASSTGKRSTISAEEAQQQKLRGREIVYRDNSYVVNQERERREREAATKQARQEAAERSRQISREWAEKQRSRKEESRSR